jgi:hypothetical protein
MNYSWTINYMDTKPSEDGLTDVVVSCQWSATATDNTLSASNYGYTQFGAPQVEDFTAYADLTQEQVLTWVWSAPPENGGVNQESMEAGLTASIAQQQNPPTVILPNPWNQPVEA